MASGVFLRRSSISVGQQAAINRSSRSHVVPRFKIPGCAFQNPGLDGRKQIARSTWFKLLKPVAGSDGPIRPACCAKHTPLSPSFLSPIKTLVLTPQPSSVSEEMSPILIGRSLWKDRSLLARGGGIRLSRHVVDSEGPSTVTVARLLGDRSTDISIVTFPLKLTIGRGGLRRDMIDAFKERLRIE